MIQNRSNNKIYIGKSVSPRKRWLTHLQVSKRGKITKGFGSIHAALAKYGFECFTFTVVDEYETANQAYAAEIDWIAAFKSNNSKYGYNMNSGGLGGTPTKETKQKLRDYYNAHPELKLKASERLKKQIKDNPELFVNVKYWLGKKHSEEHKRKVSIGMMGINVGENCGGSKLKENQVIDIRKKYNPGVCSLTDLAKEYSVDTRTIHKIILRQSWKNIPEIGNEKEIKNKIPPRIKISLTDDEIREMRKKYIPRVNTCPMLAKEYNLPVYSIFNIVTYRTFKNI